MEGIGSNTIVSVKYASTAKSIGNESGIPLSRFKAGVLPFKASKPMDMEINQDTVNSTIQIINTLKTNRKQKKGWRPNQLGVKTGYGNYDLSLANDYSQIHAAIGLRVQTANFLKNAGVTMARLADAWGVRTNQSRNTYQKLYNREAYNSKSRAALDKKHGGKRKAAEDNG